MAERPYHLRQTKPDQIMTHWDTCYALHSACMEYKVETMTEQLAQANAEILELQVDGSAYDLGYRRADDAARAVIEELRAEIERLKRDR